MGARIRTCLALWGCLGDNFLHFHILLFLFYLFGRQIAKPIMGELILHFLCSKRKARRSSGAPFHVFVSTSGFLSNLLSHSTPLPLSSGIPLFFHHKIKRQEREREEKPHRRFTTPVAAAIVQIWTSFILFSFQFFSSENDERYYDLIPLFRFTTPQIPSVCRHVGCLRCKESDTKKLATKQ